jgi:hypothetical protein
MARLTRTGYRALAILVALLASSIPARAQVLCLTEGDDIAALSTFDRAIASYVEMHRRLDAGVPQWIPADPEMSAVASNKLAEAIRVERHDAAAGDIFGPEVGDFFRARLAIVGRAAGLEPTLDLPLALDDETPACSAAPAVHSRIGWATGVPVTEPVARALPSLPLELEYRVAGRTLVLVDVPANLVVDVLLDAMP